MDAIINVSTVFVLNKFFALAKSLVAVATLNLETLNSETFAWQLKKYHQTFHSNTIKGKTL